MTKITLKRSALALCALAFIAGASLQAQDAKFFIGTWKGIIGAEGMPDLEIRVNFELDEAGRLKGTYDNITQGAFGLKLAKIAFDREAISFIIDDPRTPGEPTIKAKWGTVKGKDVIYGQLFQGDLVGIFAVERPQDAGFFIGTWKGFVSSSSEMSHLEIRINFELDEAGRLKGTYDNITRGAFGLKLANIEFDEKTISFIIHDLKAPGEATIKADWGTGNGKRIIHGSFTQGDLVGLLIVEKQ